MMVKEDIVRFIRENRGYLKQQFHIKKIGIFGSFVRGEQREGSDIDLIIEFQENTSDIYEIKEKLREFFAEHFHTNVDIAREKYLKSFAKEIIAREIEYVE